MLCQGALWDIQSINILLLTCVMRLYIEGKKH